MNAGISPEAFRAQARRWLGQVATPRNAHATWGTGPDSVAVFENLTDAAERALTDEIKDWERLRYDNGWGALAFDPDFGGRNLPSFYEYLFRMEEAHFAVPRRTEIFPVTQQLIAPAIAVWGDAEQKARWLPAMLRTDELICQLFSETEAGSDLAAVRTAAVREGDGWRLTGHKIWTSGAQVSTWGLAVCRTDPDAGKHAGITDFVVRMDAPGVTVRPIRQMTGGASFNEVHLEGVFVPDEDRLGPVGSGWKVTQTVLAAERLDSSSLGIENATKAVQLARHSAASGAALRRETADLATRVMVQHALGLRLMAALAAGRKPGPEASVGKLYATGTLRATSGLVLELLGSKVTSDNGDWGTWAWAEHLLGAPGYSIAGGTDEIQRTILSERVLGLPREDRV